jgi:hypothetical protein
MVLPTSLFISRLFFAVIFYCPLVGKTVWAATTGRKIRPLVQLKRN